jgi:hypothetical protein
MSISFLIPSRNRVDLLKKSLTSIIINSEQTLAFDFMIRMDDDQPEQCDEIMDWVNEQGYQHYVKLYCGFRHYYTNIHKYFNELSFMSDKKWLWMWNDETLMKSKGWDKIISEHLNIFQLIFPRENSCFHLCPRKLTELIGYYAPTTSCDSWQGKLAVDLDIVKWIDLDLLHDRFDITGNNLDETYLSRNYENNIADKINNNKREFDIVSKYLKENGVNY